MFQSTKINNISSILGPEVKITGDVKVSGDLLIYGKVYGDIISKGSINAAKGSLIKGNIKATNATISGTIEGDLIVESKVILGKNSYLTGNLKAAIITIEEGAKFDGMCSMIQGSSAQQGDNFSKAASTNDLNPSSSKLFKYIYGVAPAIFGPRISYILGERLSQSKTIVK